MLYFYQNPILLLVKAKRIALLLVANTLLIDYNERKTGMTKRDKLLARLLLRSHDITFDEAVAILKRFGYIQRASGKTGGSRVAFSSDDGDHFRMHKPHPDQVLKPYQVTQLLDFLKERGMI
jgi:hypothetical protein